MGSKVNIKIITASTAPSADSNPRTRLVTLCASMIMPMKVALIMAVSVEYTSPFFTAKLMSINW